MSEIQVYPHLMEKDSDNDAYIYEKVLEIVCILRGIVCLLWLGLHHWPDVRECRNSSPCYLFLKTCRKTCQVGAVETITHRCDSGADSGKRYVCIYMPGSYSCGKTIGWTRAKPTRDRRKAIFWVISSSLGLLLELRDMLHCCTSKPSGSQAIVLEQTFTLIPETCFINPGCMP